MKKLTGMRHGLRAVARHTLLLQTGLPVKQNETVDFGISSQFTNKPKYSLSILHMSLNNPHIL
jgi:hypothetical protein